jgi:stage II sporulation protein AA (anti-sigma F factor antagonist)
MVHIDTDTTTTPRAVRLFVKGQLDLTAVSPFSQALIRATRMRRAVELDLDKVDFIDGCGLSMLMNAMGRARRTGLELRIVGASRYVRRLIELTGTADRLPPLPRGREGRRAQADGELARQALQAVRAPAFRI